MTASAKRVSWIVLAVLVLLTAYQGYRVQANAFRPTGFEAVETDKAHYVLSQPVRISGSGYASFSEATLRIIGPDGGTTELPIAIDGAGDFQHSYIPQVNGRYVVDVVGPGRTLLANFAFTSGPAVWTDKEDYQPFETVVISGTEWQPGETVQLLLKEDADFHGDRILYAVADATGAFVNTEFAPEQHDLGVTFTLTATGLTSGFVAETIFTDSFTVRSRATGNWFTASTWSAARTGQITSTLASSSVTGIGTFFLSELSNLDVITDTNDNVIGTVASIGSDTSLTLTANAAIALANQPYRARLVPASDDDVVINPNHTVTVDANASANSVSTSTSTTTGLRALTIAGTNSLTIAGALNLTNTGANPSAQLNVNAGSVTAATLTADMNDATITITTGSVSISGLATIRGSASTGALATLDAGDGTFGAGSLSVLGGGGGTAEGRVLIGSGGVVNVTGNTLVDANSGLATVNVGDGQFNSGSLSIEGGGNGAKVGLVTIDGGTATVSGDVTFTPNQGVAELQFTNAAGVLNVGGNFGGGGTLETATGAGSTIHFDGIGAKTMGAYTTYRNVQIDKSGGGSVTLAGAGSTVNELLSVLQGTFDHGATASLTAVGGVSVSSGATYRDVGTGDLTLGSGFANAGAAVLNGTTAACGEADAVLIRSTSAGVQRAWSGSGSFDVVDVNVQDQAGTAAITVLSGTDNGNNGANWNFVAGCVAPPTPTPTPTDTPTNTPTDTPVPPTETPTNTPTDTPVPPTNTPANTPTHTPFPADLLGPITSNVAANPDPAPINTAITLTATVNDTTTGNSNIASAQFQVDGGSWMAMSAQDSSFNSPVENVTANIGLFGTSGVHQLCVRGTDVPGNTGAPSCIYLAVYDPKAGFVTGAGWLISPPGAYVAGPTLTGKVHFGFVSSYQRKITEVPVGQTEFQFQLGNLNFHSIVYQWLAIAGARAQYQGTGTVNGAGNYGFFVTAIDGQISGGGGVDKLRVKIWNKNAGNAVVYDNQVSCGNLADTANPCIALGGGQIKIHKK